MRLHQKSFRLRVLHAYHTRCAICRLGHEELLQAAHILPDGHPRGMPIVPNGLTLCGLHHPAFDAHVLGVSPDLEVEVQGRARRGGWPDARARTAGFPWPASSSPSSLPEAPEIPTTYDFWGLHVAIQDAMGWLDSHLHEFEVLDPSTRKVVRVGIPDDEFPDERPMAPGWVLPVAPYFREPGVTARYLYDYCCARRGPRESTRVACRRRSLRGIWAPESRRCSR